METAVVVTLVIVFALVFDFTNGFHDTANAMATSVATGALKPKVAVLISGVLNVVGAFLSTEVALTVSNGLIKSGSSGVEITPPVIFAGLVGAVIWNLVTWYFGLPSSSTHALFGGLIGAAVLAGGLQVVEFGNLLTKVVIPAVLSPFTAGLVALVGTVIVYRLTKHATMPGSVRGFRHAQTVSASLVSLAHGTSDAQKTMGVITLTLVAAHVQTAKDGVPPWVILACGLAIGLGTYLGGWRIMRTVGKRITDVEAPQGFAAEAASAATILTSAHLGFALSTTQVVSGSVIGAGVGKRIAAVRWGVAGRIASAWVLTLPCAALVGAGVAAIAARSTIGLAVMAVVAALAILGVFLLSRRKPVTAKNVNDVDESDVHEQKEAVAA